MIRDFISNTKSKKELDKLFKITGSSVLANIRKDGKQFKSEKYVSILENLNYDTYLRLPEKLQEIITKELNSLIRYYKDSDFNRTLRIIKDENDVSIRSSEDLLGIAKTISSNTNNIKNEGKQKLASMKKLPNKVSNGFKSAKNFIAYTYKFGKKVLGMAGGAALIILPRLFSLPNIFVLAGLAGGTIITLKNGFEALKMLFVKGIQLKDFIKNKIRRGKTSRIKNIFKSKQKVATQDNILEPTDIFLEEEPIITNAESIQNNVNNTNAEKTVINEDDAIDSLLTYEEPTKVNEEMSNLDFVDEKDAKSEEVKSIQETTSATLQNLEESKTELEKYRELISKIATLRNSLANSLQYYKSDLSKIKYSSKNMSHKDLYSKNQEYRIRYLQKNKYEKLLKECEKSLSYVTKIINPKTEEKSLRDIDIEILSDISDKYTQIKEKSRKF
mgnify:CR=1 FL=1